MRKIFYKYSLAWYGNAAPWFRWCGDNGQFFWKKVEVEARHYISRSKERPLADDLSGEFWYFDKMRGKWEFSKYRNILWFKMISRKWECWFRDEVIGLNHGFDVPVNSEIGIYWDSFCWWEEEMMRWVFFVNSETFRVLNILPVLNGLHKSIWRIFQSKSYSAKKEKKKYHFRTKNITTHLLRNREILIKKIFKSQFWGLVEIWAGCYLDLDWYNVLP